MFRTGSASSVFLLFVVLLLPVVFVRSFDYDDDDDDEIQPEVGYDGGRGLAGDMGVARRGVTRRGVARRGVARRAGGGSKKREAPRFTVNQDLMSLAVMLRREAQRRMVEHAMQKFAEIGRRRRRGDWGSDDEPPSPSSSRSSSFPSSENRRLGGHVVVGHVMPSPYE